MLHEDPLQRVLVIMIRIRIYSENGGLIEEDAPNVECGTRLGLTIGATLSKDTLMSGSLGRFGVQRSVWSACGDACLQITRYSGTLYLPPLVHTHSKFGDLRRSP